MRHARQIIPRSTLTVATAALIGAWAAAAHADVKIKDCDATAAKEVSAAYAFISAHLHDIIDPMKYLTSSQRDEFKRKFADETLKCRDDKNKCLKTDDLDGWAHGGPGNGVALCFYNHVDSGDTRCDLVGTIVHETGHADGFPAMKGHNNPTKEIRANDLIYRMGDDAANFCSTTTASHVLAGAIHRDLGHACTKDDQCTSEHCESGECTCNDDKDCTSNGMRKCKKGFLGFGINQCVP